MLFKSEHYLPIKLKCTTVKWLIATELLTNVAVNVESWAWVGKPRPTVGARSATWQKL
jgi:hypothetical protein